jgi:sigma-E factor negative regulatory protein RseB
MRHKKLLVFLLWAVPVMALAEESIDQVQAWLQKMHEAAHTLNYEGTFVYQQNKQLSAMRIVHAYGDDGEKERLISLDNGGREVIRDEKGVTCILPDSGSIVVEKGRPQTQFPPPFPVDIKRLQAQYVFKLAGKSTVAGQRCQKILIQPTDAYRYGHRLWVDDDTGLLLKTQLLDERGRVLEQFMFTEINFPETIAEDKLTPHINGEEFQWYEAGDSSQEKAEEGTVRKWAANRIPPGFASSAQRHHRMPDSKQPVDHLVFSDGLASVSVFIEGPDESGNNLNGGSRMGAVNAYGRKLGDYHVTAVGEVPQATVKMISESIVHQPSP